MSIRTICNHEVITVKEDATVFAAAQLMRNYHIGDVVVVKYEQDKPIPVGIVTDRDLVVEVVATALDSKVITVSDIMVRHLSTVEESAGVFETIQIMTSKGVRRLPVVNATGVLTGIITLDDLLILLSKEMGALTKLVTRELKNEATSRR